MKKVEGVKSVDFKIKAIGNGVVNWNGNTPVRGHDGKELNNHSMPKLRGYTNENGEIKEENGYRYKKLATEINFKENPLYVSSNCIRHHLFKDHSFDFHFADKDENDPVKLLISVSGLLRGFVIPKKTNPLKRKSPLLIEDFVDILGNGNFEQFGNSGAKDSNSIYSKTTFGKTEYLAHGSISIEDLQFISLDNKFDRCAYAPKNEKEAIELASKIQDFIASLEPSLKNDIKAEYGEYKRLGTIFNETECGILLNETAIQALVSFMIELIESLSIKQAKGWLTVSELELDYNDSNKMMRFITQKMAIQPEKANKYAIYYEKVGK